MALTLPKCYICLEQSDLLIPVNAASKDKLPVLQKLRIVAPFQNWLECYSICNICNDLLATSYQFIVLCGKYESDRQRLIQKEKELNISISNINTNRPAMTVNAVQKQIEIITFKIEPEIEDSQRINNNIKTDNDFENDYNFTSEDFNHKYEKCVKCNKMLPNNYELGIHLSVAHGFKCKICAKDFRTRGSLGQHNHLEHPKKISCEACGQNFSKPKTLIEHCTAQHSLKSSEVKPYMCDICQRRFAGWTSLTRHTQYHKETRNYTCKVCGKCFVTKKDVDMHELIHGNERKFGCKTCGKCFNTLPNLRTHIKCVHSDPNKRKYECYLCSKRFSIKASMEEHIKRHIGFKEHMCLICGATFIAKYDLKRHTFFHTKDRPYKCDLCENKSYRDGRGLKHHIEKCHSMISRQ